MLFRKYKKMCILLAFFFLTVLLVSCAETETQFNEIQGYNNGLTAIVDESIYLTKIDNLLTDSEEDFVDSSLNDFNPINTATVVFADDEATITNEILDTDIYMEDGNLIVDSTRKMTLIVRGTLNGSIVVNKPDGKFKLVLDGVNITSSSGPAINLQTEKRCFLVINDDTVNNITDGSLHPLMPNGSKTKAAIFSEEQLIISGEGELNVTGQYKHGIVSDDYIKVLSGNINILSAESDGLHANDYIVIDGGTININAENEGIECEKGYVVINGGKIIINSGGDGIKTSYIEEDVTITPFIHVNNGILDITSANEGINSISNIDLKNGFFVIESTNDAISAKGEIKIENGFYYLNSLEKQTLEGDLGVNIHGGTLVLLSDGTTESIKSDYNYISFKGGKIVSAGALDINLTNSTQGYLKCGEVSENEIINIMDDYSLIIVGFLRSYNHVVISTPNIEIGNTYELLSGGTIQGNNFYGLFYSGNYLDGTIKKNIIAN